MKAKHVDLTGLCQRSKLIEQCRVSGRDDIEHVGLHLEIHTPRWVRLEQIDDRLEALGDDAVLGGVVVEVELRYLVVTGESDGATAHVLHVEVKQLQGKTLLRLGIASRKERARAEHRSDEGAGPSPMVLARRRCHARILR